MPERERETIVTSRRGSGTTVAAVVALVAITFVALFLLGGDWFGDSNTNITMDTPAVNIEAPEAPNADDAPPTEPDADLQTGN